MTSQQSKRRSDWSKKSLADSLSREMVESVSHLSQSAAARRLGVSRSTICRYRKNYGVPVQKVSFDTIRRRIDIGDLERLYGLSIREACENLNISRRTLERRCAELGLSPWPRTRRVGPRRAPAPSAVPDAEPPSPEDISSGSVGNEAESYQGRVDCTPPQPDSARLAAREVTGQTVPGPVNFATTSIPPPPVGASYQGRVDCTPPQLDSARLAAREVTGQTVPGPVNFATTSVPPSPVCDTYQGRVVCTPPQPYSPRLAAMGVAGQAVPGPMNLPSTSVPQPPVCDTYQGRVDCTPPQPYSARAAAAMGVAGQAVPGPVNLASTSVPQPPVCDTYQGRVVCTPPQPYSPRLAAMGVAWQAVPVPVNFATTSVPQPPVCDTYQGRVVCTPPQPYSARAAAARGVAGQTVPGPMNLASTSVPPPPVWYVDGLLAQRREKVRIHLKKAREWASRQTNSIIFQEAIRIARSLPRELRELRNAREEHSLGMRTKIVHLEDAAERIRKEFEGNEQECEGTSTDRNVGKDLTRDRENLKALRKVLSKNLESDGLVDRMMSLLQARDVRSNMYTHSLLMAMWLAGLGHPLFGKKHGVKSSILHLQNKIEDAEINAMLDFGILLRLQDLVPPVNPYHDGTKNGIRDDPSEARRLQISLVSDLEEADRRRSDDGRDDLCRVNRKTRLNLSRQRFDRLTADGRGALRLLINKEKLLSMSIGITMTAERRNFTCLSNEVKKMRLMSTEEVLSSQERLSQEINRLGPDAWSRNVSQLDVRRLLKRKQEVKLRLHPCKQSVPKIDGCGETPLACFTSVLGRATSLCNAMIWNHHNGGPNPYTDSFTMAVWLCSLGFESGVQRTMDDILLVERRIKSGEFNAMSALFELLNQHDLPLPPQIFFRVRNQT